MPAVPASQALVERQLAPYQSAIAEAICTAFTRWRALPADYLADTTHGRTRSACIWSLMIAEVKKALSPFPGVRSEEKGNTCNFYIGSAVLFRLKKLSRKGMSRNYPTQTSLDFYAQLELPGMPQAVRVDVGYVPNDVFTKPEKILVACRDGKTLEWVYPIDLPGAATVVGTIAPDSPSAPRRSRVRVPRNRKVDSDKNSGTGTDAD